MPDTLLQVLLPKYYNSIPPPPTSVETKDYRAGIQDEVLWLISLGEMLFQGWFSRAWWCCQGGETGVLPLSWIYLHNELTNLLCVWTEDKEHGREVAGEKAVSSGAPENACFLAVQEHVKGSQTGAIWAGPHPRAASWVETLAARDYRSVQLKGEEEREWQLARRGQARGNLLVRDSGNGSEGPGALPQTLCSQPHDRTCIWVPQGRRDWKAKLYSLRPKLGHQ